MNPFNNKVYKGVCERVKEPTTLTYNRLPWNVAVLNYEVHLKFKRNGLVKKIKRITCNAFKMRERALCPGVAGNSLFLFYSESDALRLGRGPKRP